MLRHRTRDPSRPVHPRCSGFAAAWVGIATLCGEATASAQTQPSIDVRTWRPSTDSQAMMVLEPTATPGAWQWNVGVGASYAERPVALRDSTGQVVGRPLAHALGADVVAGMGLGGWAAVGVAVPFFLWDSGTSGGPTASADNTALPTAGIGDLSLVGKVTLLSNEHRGLVSGFGVAAVADVTLPTGNQASFMGEGALTSKLRVLGEWALPVIAVRAWLGYGLRTERRTWPAPPFERATFGDGLPWSFGIVAKPKAAWPSIDPDDRQTWELAAHGELPVSPVAPFATGAGALSPALLGVDDRIAIGRRREVYLLAGADIGLDDAIGVPEIRGVLSLGWAPRKHDRDEDGVDDDVDQCPDLPEDRDGIQDEDGCPEDDADADDVPDTEDACPLVPGPASPDPKRNGCP